MTPLEFSTIIGVLYVGILQAPFIHQRNVIVAVFLTIVIAATLVSLVLLFQLALPSEVPGYVDHRWNGVTTLQFSELCRDLILRDSFDAIRSEASVHHFCPNQAVSKYELLQLFNSVYKSGVTVKPVKSARGPVHRILDTCYSRLKEFYGYGRPMERAIEEMAAWEANNHGPAKL